MLDHTRSGKNFDERRLAQIIAAHVARKGALLPILHEIMQEFGSVDDAMVPAIAEGLNISRADVHGVVTFYHDFRRQPAGRHVVRLCIAEACKAMGADELATYAQTRLGLPMHSTSGDAAVTLEPVYCLGLCSLSPSAMINGRIYGRLSKEKLDLLLAEVAT